MTGLDNSSSSDKGEDLNELLEPASKLQTTAEQEGESIPSVWDDNEPNQDSAEESELDELLPPASVLRSAAEHHTTGSTGDEQDDSSKTE